MRIKALALFQTFIFLSERETTLQAAQPVSSVKFTNENLKKKKKLMCGGPSDQIKFGFKLGGIQYSL